MFAETILYNGRIYTMDPARPLSEALAFAGGRVLATGRLADLEGIRGRETLLVDLNRRVLLPAFTDSHIHLAAWALSRRQIDLRRARSLAIALREIAAVAAARPDQPVLRGVGWDANHWPDLTGLPNRQMLDAVVPNRPLLLADHALHTLWVNSAALRAANIDAHSDDPPGGHIERDEHGAPTGILRESAMTLVERALPQPSVPEIVAAVTDAQPWLWQRGIVGVHEMGDLAAGDNLRAYQQLRRDGALQLRVLYYFSAGQLPDFVAAHVEAGFGDDLLRIAGAKFFADGALGPQTAWLSEPYERSETRFGMATLEEAAFTEALRCLIGGKLGVAVHAIGDAAVRFVLDRFEDVLAGQRWPAGRYIPAPRVEHAQLLRPQDFARFAALGVAASMQPIHALSDMEMAAARWGDRVTRSYAWQSLLRHGARLLFGSDAPVEAPDVWAGIAAAVTRRRPDGTPGPGGWVPQERVAVADALYAYTVAPARVANDPARGALSPGHLADMILVDADPFELAWHAPLQLNEVRTLATWLAGRRVYTDDRADFG